ncbi:hypothetical protein L6164_028998 [Bauhinia variegata]|uniref:Uncharacterized protein n=1 Tax=Bauhinia variegata TaxID=167791 RepID=A0ACB9L7V8_BAUVA|nr:hypothetical protein L6164_028998 [Bauhinia variegata]
MLYELIMAAYHLNVKGLYDLTCRAVANMIKGKTTKEIRTILNIKNDFDIFEEWEILMQNQWAIRTIEM